MRVPSHRVGPLDSGQLVAMLRGQQHATAPRGVHVEPQLVSLADVRHLLQWIKGPVDSRSGCAASEERRQAVLLALDYLGLQRFRNHLSVLISWDVEAVISADSTDCRSTFDRVVTLESRIQVTLFSTVNSHPHWWNSTASGCPSCPDACSVATDDGEPRSSRTDWRWRLQERRCRRPCRCPIRWLPTFGSSQTSPWGWRPARFRTWTWKGKDVFWNLQM